MSKTMSEKILKRLIPILMIFAVTITSVPAISVQAAGGLSFPETIKVRNFPKRLKSEKIQSRRQWIWDSKGKITQLKSSDKKVAIAKKGKTDLYPCIEITPKSAGTTKISFKCGGKKCTSTVYVTDYENPFKSIKIGKKDFTTKFDKSNEYVYKQKHSMTGKLKIKLKKDWKIKTMYTEYIGDEGTQGDIVKNNKNVSLRTNVYGGKTQLIILLQNKKTKETMEVTLEYSKMAKKSGNVYWS